MFVLADHPEYRITFHPGNADSNRVVVTFGGQPSGLSDTGFGSQFVMAEGWHHVFVAQAAGSQYQGLAAKVFKTALSPFAGMDVVCYGASLGGYAALYFGGQIDARIIAAAPLLPAWPPFENIKYRDVRIRHGDLRRMRRSRHAPVVIYDPAQLPDVKILNGMVRPTYPDIRELALPFSGHTVMIAVSRAGQIKKLIKSIIEEDRILSFDLPEEGSDIWHRERGRALSRHHPQWARIELERALAIMPSKSTLSSLMSILMKVGDLDAAQALLDRCAASEDPHMRIVPSTGRIAMARGLRVDPILMGKSAT